LAGLKVVVVFRLTVVLVIVFLFLEVSVDANPFDSFGALAAAVDGDQYSI
jgi:hypothetical protein